MSFEIAMAVFFGFAIGAFVCTVLLLTSRRKLDQAEKMLGEAAEFYERSNEIMSRRGGELRITRFHREDPILRPLRLLLVMMPDPDFETVVEDGSDIHLAAATTRGSERALAEADYAIAIWPQDGHIDVLKWKDMPEAVIEAHAYYGESS